MEKIKENIVLDEGIKIIFNETLINIFNDVEPDYENNCMKGITLKIWGTHWQKISQHRQILIIA